MRSLLVLLFATLISISSFAQQGSIYTHYYTNPYIYNPAYAGIEGRPMVSLTHRRQWLGIEDAPITSNFTYHSPLFAGLNMGLNVTQDNYGIFKTSGALLSFSYKISLGFNHYLSFGLSGGGKFQNIDIANINVSDPALAGVLSKNTQLDGNVGLAYHIGSLSLGVSLQNIFHTEVFSTEQFDQGHLGLIRNYIVTADYMIYFANDNFIFQPYGLYRSNENYKSQYEAGAILHLKNLLWVGGSYREDFGIIGLLGIKLKSAFSISYAYEIPATKAEGINKTSHEINLNLAFGKKKKRAKKYQTFLASKKPKKDKKKKKEEVVEEDVEEPIIAPIQEEPEDKEDAVIAVAPIPIPLLDVLDSMNQDGNKIRLIVEGEAAGARQEGIEKDVEEIGDVDKTKLQITTEGLVPAAVTKKGNHPFELDQGHYIIVGAFGAYKNAIRANDKLLSQGYDADFGFSSEKGLFYVFILGENSPEGARSKRDELRNLPAFKNAWYLLVE